MPHLQLFGLGPTVFHHPGAVGFAVSELPAEHLGSETSLLSDHYDLWRKTVPQIREHVHAGRFHEAEDLKEGLASHVGGMRQPEWNDFLGGWAMSSMMFATPPFQKMHAFLPPLSLQERRFGGEIDAKLAKYLDEADAIIAHQYLVLQAFTLEGKESGQKVHDRFLQRLDNLIDLIRHPAVVGREDFDDYVSFHAPFLEWVAKLGERQTRLLKVFGVSEPEIYRAVIDARLLATRVYKNTGQHEKLAHSFSRIAEAENALADIYHDTDISQSAHHRRKAAGALATVADALSEAHGVKATWVRSPEVGTREMEQVSEIEARSISFYDTAARDFRESGSLGSFVEARQRQVEIANRIREQLTDRGDFASALENLDKLIASFREDVRTLSGKNEVLRVSQENYLARLLTNRLVMMSELNIVEETEPLFEEITSHTLRVLDTRLRGDFGGEAVALLEQLRRAMDISSSLLAVESSEQPGKKMTLRVEDDRLVVIYPDRKSCYFPVSNKRALAWIEAFFAVKPSMKTASA